MKKEELKKKVEFISKADNQTKLMVYVTTSKTEPQLFNIEESDLPDLQAMITRTLSSIMLNDDKGELEKYSISVKRGEDMYIYDLSDDYTNEMDNLKTLTGIIKPELFDASVTPIEEINGVYYVLKSDSGEVLSAYKQISALDKTYARSMFLLFGKHNSMFSRQKANMLKLTPSIQMVKIGEDIILLDIKKLEKSLHLDEILKKETTRNIKAISSKLIVNDNFLRKACERPMYSKKLGHALSVSKVVKKLDNGDLTENRIIEFAEKESKVQFHFNKSHTKFELKSRAEAERFIKLMDDDFLHSALTDEDYDSSDKDIIEKEKGKKK